MPRRRLALLLALIAVLGVASLTPASAEQAAGSLLVTAPVRVSAPSSYAPDCAGVPQEGKNFRNSAVEPRVAVDPRDAAHIVAVWQQDRWSNGGAAGLQTAVSRDAGRSWTLSAAPFSRCSGGTPENGGDYERASDPWVSFAPNGDLYQSALVISGAQGRRTSAILVSRSTDGGLTWSSAVRLNEDREPAAFNDKESITADPFDSRFAYAVWDRIDERVRGLNGPAWFSRTTDGGLTWEEPRAIVSPVGQTIANQIVLLPNGDLLDVFTLLEAVRGPDGRPVARQSVQAIRSSDRGETWSAPAEIAAASSAAVPDEDEVEVEGVEADVRAGAPIVEAAVDGYSGALYVTWQDARFSGGYHADVALTVSRDRGQTWSAPIRVNQTPGDASAFTPNVAVLADGTVGVSYYDLRTNTPDPATLPAAYWLATCHAVCEDPANWRETQVAAAFELTAAPRAGDAFFIGDYQGLAARGSTFVLLFAEAGIAAGRPSDIWFATAGPGWGPA